MSKGRFGIHGGQYIPETLMNAVIELEEAYNHYKNDPAFNAELTELLNNYAGRPSRLYFAKHMTNDLGGSVSCLSLWESQEYEKWSVSLPIRSISLLRPHANRCGIIFCGFTPFSSCRRSRPRRCLRRRARRGRSRRSSGCDHRCLRRAAQGQRADRESPARRGSGRTAP